MPGTQPHLPPIPLDRLAPQDDALIGQKVGEYVIEAPIAAGGMGIVYRAVHPLIGRRVAIKVVRPEMVSDKDQADRFLKEAQALSAIKHRGIIEVIGFGNLSDARQYMVMEFLEGESLEAVMDREGAMSAARALPLIDEILSGLAAAHKAGVVHRDLKPSNVFISLATSGERNVKVLDFGLAKHAPIALEQAVGDAGSKSSLLAGTPEYIAPEQASGLAATPQTDLYCVGVMLFEMLSGGLPFSAPSVVELMRKHVNEAPPRLSARVNGLPESLDALVAVLLEKDPLKRPASADVARQTVTRILRELREQSTRQAPNPLLAPLTAVAPPASITARLPLRIAPAAGPAQARDNRPLVAVLVLLLLLGTAGALWFLGRAPEAVGTIAPPAPTVVHAIEAPRPIEVLPVAVPKPVEPPVPKPVPVPDPDFELVALKPRPPPEPAPKVVLVPRNAVDNSDCKPDSEWKASQRKWIEKLENTHTELMAATPRGAPDPAVIARLHQLRDRVDAAESSAACVQVGAALEAWQRKYNP